MQMQKLDLHEYDEEVWHAPKLQVMAGVNALVISEYGGSQTTEMKEKILHALYEAVQKENIERMKALARLLEARYGTARSTLPRLLLELQTEEFQTA